LNTNDSYVLSSIKKLYPLIISVNVTKNTFELLDGSFTLLDGLQKKGVLDDLILTTLDTLHPDYKKGFLDSFSRESFIRKNDRGQKQDVFVCLMLAKGGYQWRQFLSINTENSEGDLTELILVRPIIDYKRIEAEQKIQLQARQINLILGAIPGGLTICKDDKDFTYQHVSTEAAALFGYTVEEFLQVTNGKATQSVIKEDSDSTNKEIESFLASGSDFYTMHYRIRCKNGNIKYILHYGKKDLDFSGNHLFYNFLLDVTKEFANKSIIENQQALIKEKEQTEQMYKLITALSQDYSSVYLINFDEDTADTIYCKDIENCYGLNLNITNERYSKVRNSIAESLLYNLDRTSFLESSKPDNIRRHLKNEDAYAYSYRIEKNGQLTNWQCKCVSIDPSDKISQIIMGFKNIDNELSTEQERNRILQEALTQAQYSNKAKTLFLNNMSHDIRTPMNAIIGYTALASSHIDDQRRVLDYLKKISQSSNHLLSLINDVLDMSRIESGKLHLEEKGENLSEIMHDIRNIIHNDIVSKQLDLFIDTVDVTNEDIYCDRLRINQILLNLLSNAIKFTAPGGVISVRIVQESTSPRGYATYSFRIKDTGIGMTPEFMEHIFEPFTRERTTTVSGIQGTGLGMSITKNIVDMYGGTIEVYSKEGQGSEFIVTLRFRLQTTISKSPIIKSLEGLRGLVVDDDMNTCQSVSRMLRQIGLRSEWCMYGKEAVERVRESVEIEDKYHVYIIDWLMPDLNGIETARRIRNVVGDDAPIIILSAYDWTDIEEEAKAAGVTSFVSKPIFLSDLRSVLLSVCEEATEETSDTKKESEELLSDKRILLVEDNELNREIAQELLSDAGIKSDAAENGAVALEMLLNNDPNYYDLILMDIQMPIMDGYAATEAIRKMENHTLANIPVVAMTANAFEQDKELALASGMNDHLSKPINIANLLRVIKSLLT